MARPPLWGWPSRRQSSAGLCLSSAASTRRKLASNTTISSLTVTSQSLTLTRGLDPILRIHMTAQTSIRLPLKTSTPPSSSTVAPLTSSSQTSQPLLVPNSKSVALSTPTFKRWEPTTFILKIRKTIWSSLTAFQMFRMQRARTAPTPPAQAPTTTQLTRSRSTATRKNLTWWPTTILLKTRIQCQKATSVWPIGTPQSTKNLSSAPPAGPPSLIPRWTLISCRWTRWWRRAPWSPSPSSPARRPWAWAPPPFNHRLFHSNHKLRLKSRMSLRPNRVKPETALTR